MTASYMKKEESYKKLYNLIASLFLQLVLKSTESFNENSDNSVTHQHETRTMMIKAPYKTERLVGFVNLIFKEENRSKVHFQHLHLAILD